VEEEFIDFRWTRLQSDLRMVEFWSILTRNHINEVAGKEFLNEVWNACAVEDDLEIDQSYYKQLKDEQALWNSIKSFERKHNALPSWLKLVGAPDECPPEILAAFSSQKSNFVLERGRHLVVIANARFQRPLYECVVIAVNVALGLEDDCGALNVGTLKNSCLRGR
jgi:hypothetical protein